MGLRCKPNDLAIVLKGKYVGYYVTIIKFIGPATRIWLDGTVTPEKDFWETTFPRGVEPIKGSNGRCGYPDDELLPVSPGELKETEAEEAKREIQ